MAILTIGLALAKPANAGVIFESAPPGPAGLTGGDPAISGPEKGSILIASFQATGMRFHVGTPTEIVPLDDEKAMPSGSPFDSSTLASAIFSPGLTTGDYFASLSVTVQPGWYGLVMGSAISVHPRPPLLSWCLTDRRTHQLRSGGMLLVLGRLHGRPLSGPATIA